MSAEKKNGNGWAKWLTIIGVLSAVLTAGGALAYNNGQTAQNKTDIADNKLEVRQTFEKIDDRMRLQEQYMAEQRTDIKWIRAAIEKTNGGTP